MSILCKLGFHKPDITYLKVTKYRKRSGCHGNKYHRYYHICVRCGKRLGIVSFKRVVW